MRHVLRAGRIPHSLPIDRTINPADVPGTTPGYICGQSATQHAGATHWMLRPNCSTTMSLPGPVEQSIR